jgi:glycosyltransferase involved in cell wall biosynthesis
MMAANRRLAFLITGLDHGGAETQLLRLTAALQDRGWEVLVISILPCAEFGRSLAGPGVRVESLDLRRGAEGLRALWLLVRLLRGWRPAVLTSFLYHANLLGRVAGRLSGVPVVISSERCDRYGGRHRYWLLGATDRWADATVTNSRLVGERLVRERVIDGGRLRVVPNALSATWAVAEGGERQGVREALGVADDEFLWVAVGRVDPAKDYPTLLRAFDLHRRNHPRSQLRIAGAGDPGAPLAALPPELRAASAGAFLGHRDDVRELLAAADGFVMSSRIEGFPNALMEALASGLPAVATAVGGVAELVEDGVGGFLAPAEDPRRLAEAMGRLEALPEERRRQMGEAGREHVLGVCGLTAVVNVWESLFEELLLAKGVAGSRPLDCREGDPASQREPRARADCRR